MYSNRANFSVLEYRKRLNNGPPFLHACTIFVYEMHV